MAPSHFDAWLRSNVLIPLWESVPANRGMGMSSFPPELVGHVANVIREKFYEAYYNGYCGAELESMKEQPQHAASTGSLH
jgi:hypothetical protein